MVSQESLLLQLFYQIYHQAFLIRAISPRDDDVNVTASLLSSPVRSASFDDMKALRFCSLIYFGSDKIQYFFDFCSRDPSLKLLDVPQTNSLVFVEQLLSGA